MDIQDIVIPAATVLVSISVSWGIMRTEVTTMKETMKDLSRKMDSDCVTREGCRLRHEYIDRDMEDIKKTLGQIKTSQDETHSLLLQLVQSKK